MLKGDKCNKKKKKKARKEEWGGWRGYSFKQGELTDLWPRQTFT